MTSVLLTYLSEGRDTRRVATERRKFEFTIKHSLSEIEVVHRTSVLSRSLHRRSPFLNVDLALSHGSTQFLF